MFGDNVMLLFASLCGTNVLVNVLPVARVVKMTLPLQSPRIITRKERLD